MGARRCQVVGVCTLQLLESSQGQEKGESMDPREPAPLVDGWLKPVQRIASLVL